MSDPTQPSTMPSSRLSTVPPPSIYTFSHIFPPATVQSDFFVKTTLPLVKDVLEGQSGLLFTYGVTNSGKTYTIQGGNEQGSAGILPRTLDVIFNSIDGLHGDGRVMKPHLPEAPMLITYMPSSAQFACKASNMRLPSCHRLRALLPRSASHRQEDPSPTSCSTCHPMIQILIRPLSSSTATTSTPSGSPTPKSTTRKCTTSLHQSTTGRRRMPRAPQACPARRQASSASPRATPTRSPCCSRARRCR